MTVKRRTIWMTDEDWAYLLRCAKDRAMNASQLVHALLPAERVIAAINLNDHSPKGADWIEPHVTIETAGPRPFTPAPKPSKRHG